MNIWSAIADVLKNFWPMYIILPILLFFRDKISAWFLKTFKKGQEKVEEEKFDQHAAKYEQRWTKEIQVVKANTSDKFNYLETKIDEKIFNLEDKIDSNKQRDDTFQSDVNKALISLDSKLDLIQNTQNNNCDNMGKRLTNFQKSVSGEMGIITKGLLSVQQSDLERDCLSYQTKGGMTAKEKRDFEKRWKMYKDMGGDDLEWIKEAVSVIPIVSG